MGWSVGYDSDWRRDIGYGVPAMCDMPGCTKEIDRGLGYVCGGEPYGGETGCGLFFCGQHGGGSRRCGHRKLKLQPTPDVAEWIEHKLTDESWQQWRDENPKEVARLRAGGATQAAAAHIEGTTS